MATAVSVPEKTQTRKDLDIWLVGKMLMQIEGNQLPTSEQVLGRLFYLMRKENRTLSDGASQTIDEVFQFWFNANVPTTQKPNAVAKLKALYEGYTGLSKNKSRKSETQKDNEAKFKTRLIQLFDVAHAEAEKKIPIRQDWEFLVDQRGPRKMIMVGEDLAFKEKQERRAARVAAESRRREEAAAESIRFAEVVSSAVSPPETSSAFSPSADAAASDDEVSEDEFADVSRYHQSRMLSAAGDAPTSSSDVRPSKAMKLDP